MTSVFVGVTLAITAFPMLARIIIERGLSGTRFGSLSLACGGIDDMAAWILLAGVLSLASARLWLISKALVGAVLFAAVLALVVRPVLNRYLGRPGLSAQTVLLVTMTLMLAAAWFTSFIGLYTVFGAFSIGLVMPPVNREIPAAAMDGISRMLVPMFFTYSGLNTHFALLGQPRLLVFSAAAIVVAVLSKGGACWLGARLAGEPGPVAARVGTLMNARGLMQLIALNVGLEAHIVSQELFTSLVLVALVTTVMTAPLLSWLDHRDALAQPGPAALPPELEGAIG